MIQTIVCAQEDKERLIQVALASDWCFTGTGACEKFMDGVHSDCRRCLEKNIEWVIVNTYEEAGDGRSAAGV